MKKLLYFLLATALFISCKQNSGEKNAEKGGNSANSEASPSDGKGKTYGIKAGILISEMDMMGMGKATVENNFDDYGSVSLTNTKTSIMSMNTVTHSLKKDGWIYVWSDGQKEGQKFKLDAKGFAKDNMDIEALTDEMKQKMNFKEEGSADVLGKSCKVYSMTISEKGMDMAGKIYVWEKLALKSEFGAKDINIVMEPKSLDEHPSFAAGFFDVPAGITFSEMQNNQAPPQP